MFTLPYRNYCRLTVGENRSPKNGQSTVGMDFHISGHKKYSIHEITLIYAVS